MNFEINKLKKSEDLALFLGMFAGDGCLTIGHNGFGYRTYPVCFVNTNIDYINLFTNLFYKLFKIKGSISVCKRQNKKDLWCFQKCSFQIYNLINREFEIPVGKKARIVRIPSFIMKGSQELQRHFFYGLLITDGSLRKRGDIMFHSSSQNLIYDLKDLVKSLWGFERNVHHYVQRNKFHSYQLTLNKSQSSIILPQLPMSHNLALR